MVRLGLWRHWHPSSPLSLLFDCSNGRILQASSQCRGWRNVLRLGDISEQSRYSVRQKINGCLIQVNAESNLQGGVEAFTWEEPESRTSREVANAAGHHICRDQSRLAPAHPRIHGVFGLGRNIPHPLASGDVLANAREWLTSAWYD